MEYVALAEFVKYGTAPLLLVLIILMVVVLVGLRNLREIIDEIKDGITWGDACNEKHKALDRRVDGLEHRVEKIEERTA